MNDMQGRTTEQIRRDHVVAAAGWEPRIVGLVCNWCTYAGADMAGTARLKYPANVRLVRFPCTGRMSPLMILKAFEHGADGVLVSGCHPGDCHYVHGNLVARRRFTVLRSLLDFIGLDLRRIHFGWVSAAEGQKWATVVEQVTAAVREAGPMPPFGTSAEPPPVVLPPAPRKNRPPSEPGQLEALRTHMRATAADLLASAKTRMVIGYTRTSMPNRAAPAMLAAAAEAETLDWGEGCHTNLATYLPAAVKTAGRVGVMVKRCDMRAILGLVRENQIRAEDLVLVGAPCPGVTDGRDIAAKCLNCDGKPHALCDIVIGVDGAREGERRAETEVDVPSDPRDQEVAYLESLPAAVRWQYWQRQFARCLRCYACRATCPLCYCDSCIAEKHKPQWISPAIENRGNTAWNVVRAFHLAGRCTGCDECARACPADIRLDLINHKLRLETERHFRRPASDPQARSVLVDFRLDDPDDFVL